VTRAFDMRTAAKRITSHAYGRSLLMVKSATELAALLVGETVAIGQLEVGPSSDEFPNDIRVYPSAHATSQRAQVRIGDWEINQDLTGSGTENLGVYSVDGAANVMTFPAAGSGAMGGTYFERGTYSPTLANGGAGTTGHSHWTKIGNTVRVAYYRAFTGAGTGAMSLPVPFNFGGNSGSYETVGSGYWYDASGGGHIMLSVRRQAATNIVEFVRQAGGGVMTGSELANGDAIAIEFHYEWA
jgi:hypothetical protein